MKTRISVCVTVILILTTLTYPSSAFGQVETFSYKGELTGAMASFSSIDEAGIQTEVTVFAHDDKHHVAQSPVVWESGMEMWIRRFDPADPYNYFMRAKTFFPVLADKDFMAPAISPGSWATLNTAVDVFDYVSNSWFTVFIDLTWVCTGDVDRSQHHHTAVEPGLSVDIRSSNSTWCLAQASGSVSDGATDFTPAPSVEASIFGEGTVEIEIGIEH